jgi:hypothetical protein
MTRLRAEKERNIFYCRQTRFLSFLSVQTISETQTVSCSLANKDPYGNRNAAESGSSAQVKHEWYYIFNLPLSLYGVYREDLALLNFTLHFLHVQPGASGIAVG